MTTTTMTQRTQCVALTNLNPSRREDSISDNEHKDTTNPTLGLQQLRLGAYACKCPVGLAHNRSDQVQLGPTSSKTHQHLASLASRRRESLSESILARASGSTSPAYGLDQLALEPLDKSLLDKRLVGEKLLELEQLQLEAAANRRGQLFKGHRFHGGVSESGNGDTSDQEEHQWLKRLRQKSLSGNIQNVRHSAGSQLGAGRQYFALGAQLEADAILEWFAEFDDGKQQQANGATLATGFPIDNCLICKQNGPNSDQLLLASDCKPIDGYNNDYDLPSNSWLSLAHWIRPLVLALQLICICLTLVLIAFTIRVRKSRIIIVSGWLMLETMLIGALLLFTNVLVQYFQPTSITCLLGPWFRELGFSIFYGSILIKLHKILTEFQTRKAHRVCFRDQDQIIYLLGIVFIVIIYMSAWTAQIIDRFHMESILGSSEANLEGFLQQNETSSFEESLRRRLEVQDFHQLVAEPINGDRRNNLGLSVDPRKFRFLIRRSMNQGAQLNGTNLTNYTSKSFDTRSEDNYHFMMSDSHFDHELPGSSSKIFNNLLQVTSSQEAALVDGNLARVETKAKESIANNHLERLVKELDSLDKIFSGLLEAERQYDPVSDLLVYSTRCRKLTWDYVTEMSELALLLFGLHLVYKLRNASSEIHKEKLILSVAVFLELLVSSGTYLLRHALWHQLNQNYLLAIYSLRSQLTVSLTVALVFWPKFWKLGKSKPNSLFGAFASSTSSTLGAAGQQAGATGSAAGGGSHGQQQRGKGSVRHRCHISCEIHDHHLNDATKLHQAMLSNSALEIGSINLADMDPDEIQAELKRVYTQLEVLKTKVMRRDNPHISKRRGGRKPGHRKFSLQAFHARHSSSGAVGTGDAHHHQQHHHENNNDSMGTSNGNRLLARGSSFGVEHVGAMQVSASGGTVVAPAISSTAGSAHRLPALAETDVESPPPAHDQPQPRELPSGKHVRVEDPGSLTPMRRDEDIVRVQAFHHYHSDNQQQQQQQRQQHCSWLLHKTKHYNNQRNNAKQAIKQRHCNLKSKQTNQSEHKTVNGNSRKNGPQEEYAPEPASTSSLCLDDDALIIANDSQSSSGDMSLRGISSVVCSQSSIHPDEPPNN